MAHMAGEGAIPASDSRAPRASALTVLIGGALILYAVQSKPGGYELGEVPDVFVSVVGRYFP